MSNNKVKDWKEFDQLKDMSSLEELLFVGNPLQVKHTEEGGTHCPVTRLSSSQTAAVAKQ